MIAALRRWSREPLARFALIGATLLVADRLLLPAGEPGRIVVTASQQDALRAQFRAEHGRAPGDAELAAQVGRWVDEEVLYREALALGLDRRDTLVRRQLTQRMRLLLDERALPEATAQELQAWLEAHPERYGRATTVSFEHVFLSRGRHGAALPQAAAEAAARLARAPDAFVGIGDAFLVGQVVSEADAARVRREFGADFAARVDALEPGRWAGPVPSGFGLHLVRVTARGAFEPARLDDVAERVRTDWRVARREARERETLERLRANYRIELEPAA